MTAAALQPATDCGPPQGFRMAGRGTRVKEKMQTRARISGLLTVGVTGFPCGGERHAAPAVCCAHAPPPHPTPPPTLPSAAPWGGARRGLHHRCHGGCSAGRAGAAGPLCRSRGGGGSRTVRVVAGGVEEELEYHQPRAVAHQPLAPQLHAAPARARCAGVGVVSVWCNPPNQHPL